MRSFIIQWMIGSLALLGTAYLIPGFKVKNFRSCLIAALIVGFLNWTVRPILLFITIPINFLTLGLFTLVINAIVLKICAKLTPGFDIVSWWAAIFGAIVLSLLTYGGYWLLDGYYYPVT
ncbi:MAG: phage holin family protein [Proteobacteria bacterium]|nr:MAG: phage holin family protein [Pseudomonadota bacterium]